MVFALGTLIMYGTGSPGAPLYRSVSSFARDASHNRLLAVPAALYAVNNYMKFAMQLYFKPTTAKMLSNLKVRQRRLWCTMPPCFDQTSSALGVTPTQHQCA